MEIYLLSWRVNRILIYYYPLYIFIQQFYDNQFSFSVIIPSIF